MIIRITRYILDPNEPRWVGWSEGREIRSNDIEFVNGQAYLWNEIVEPRGRVGFWVEVESVIDRFVSAVIERLAQA